jgi:hypothetical protein
LSALRILPVSRAWVAGALRAVAAPAAVARDIAIPRAATPRAAVARAALAALALTAIARAADLCATTWARSLARAAVSVLLVTSAISSSACSATHFDGQVFRKGDVAFRLERLPPTWRHIEIDDTALAFRDDENAATVAINGRCGKDAEDVPLKSLTQHLFLQFTDRNLEDQELFALDGREALRTEMTAKLDGVQKYFHVVVLKKDGCVYDFLQIANQHQDEQPFLEFVRGFQSLG